MCFTFYFLKQLEIEFEIYDDAIILISTNAKAYFYKNEDTCYFAVCLERNKDL